MYGRWCWRVRCETTRWRATSRFGHRHNDKGRAARDLTRGTIAQCRAITDLMSPGPMPSDSCQTITLLPGNEKTIIMLWFRTLVFAPSSTSPYCERSTDMRRLICPGSSPSSSAVKSSSPSS